MHPPPSNLSIPIVLRLLCVCWILATASQCIAQGTGRYPLNPAGNVGTQELPAQFRSLPTMPDQIQHQFGNANDVWQVQDPAQNLPIVQDTIHQPEPLGDGQWEVSSFLNTQTFEPTLTYEHSSLELPRVPPLFVPHSSRTSNEAHYLAPYQSRPQTIGFEEGSVPNSELPPEFTPWWTLPSATAIGIRASPLQVSLDLLIQRALSNSPHIQIAAAKPHISQAKLVEESAQFDWLSFLETKYDDLNDPIGNTLTTGNNDDRFVQQELSARGGLRRRNANGSEVELSQRLGTMDNNSRFLLPPDQGNARLELSYRHPLLRGQGTAVNQSLILLAEIDFRKASDEFLGQIQTHLTDLTETYWELVRARSELLQRQRLLTKAQEILEQLEGRAEVDALDRQIYRAKAAVAKRKAEIARSVTSVKNAESRIRLLVNDREIIDASGRELVPADIPSMQHLPINLGDAISTALSNRPDISQAIREISTTSVRLGVARNDLMPKLDLVVGSYVAGLDGDFDAMNSWVNQFRDGRPGFNVGFEFEIPIGNRAAIARQDRRQWEANKALHEFRAVVETGLTEVEIAVREVHTAYQEMQGRYFAMLAASNESSFLADRWQTLPGLDDSVTLLLEDLLDSQERLANEESAFAKAQFDYSVSLVRLKQSMGTLFLVN